MAVTKKAKPKKAATVKSARPKTWQDAIRLHLAKVATVDAVFVNTASDTIHVYSIVERFRDDSCGELMEQEAKTSTIMRAEGEIEFWNRHVEEVQKYTREQAITELISALKIHEKIASIRKFVKQLPKDEKLG